MFTRHVSILSSCLLLAETGPDESPGGVSQPQPAAASDPTQVRSPAANDASQLPLSFHAQALVPESGGFWALAPLAVGMHMGSIVRPHVDLQPELLCFDSPAFRPQGNIASGLQGNIARLRRAVFRLTACCLLNGGRRPEASHWIICQLA